MFLFKISDVKSFMIKLLKEDSFDLWEVRSIDIITFAKFQINGSIDKDFYPKENVGNYNTWADIKPYVLQMVKGSQKPKVIKIVFSASQVQTVALHKNAAAYFLNLNFENGEIICTGASSEKEFLMDKTVDSVWEEYITGFFNKSNIIISTQI